VAAHVSTVELPVVVVHHGAPGWCRETVAAIEASTGIRARVYVVDNGGLPALRPGDLPSSVTVVRPGRNVGYSGGANVGLRRALVEHPGAPWVAVACHDARPDPPTLRHLVRALDANPSIGIVAPRLRGATTSTGGTWHLGRARNHPTGPVGGDVIDRDWVSGCLLVLRRACLGEVGGFDERFGSYVEDVDLCLRASDAGWRVVCATDTAVSTAGSASCDRYRLAASNAIGLVAKRRGRAAASVAALRYLARGVRALLLGILARHRTATRRKASGRWGAANVRAAVGSPTRALVRTMAMDPSGGVPVLGIDPMPGDADQQLGRASATR